MSDRKKVENKKNERTLADDAFHLLYRVVIYISVPAIGLAFLGKWIDAQMGTGRMWSFILLAIGFFFSWFLIFMDYRRIQKKHKKNNENSKDVDV